MTYEPKPVRGMHPDPLGAVGKSFWEDVIGTLLPWEVEKEKAPIPQPRFLCGGWHNVPPRSEWRPTDPPNYAGLSLEFDCPVVNYT